MSIILDTLRSYAGRTNDRQNNTSNTIVHNQRICSGWGYILGDGSVFLTKTVNLPISFDDYPIIEATQLGFTTTLPTSVTNFKYSAPAMCHVREINNNNFTLAMYSPDVGGTARTLVSGRYYGFTWVAIGTYNEYE